MNLESIVAYAAEEPPTSSEVLFSQYFDESKMCEHCLMQVTNGDSHQNDADNVVSIFSRCRLKNGCVVCGFCGAAMFDLIEDVFGTRREMPDCPRCGNATYAAAIRFVDFRDAGKPAESDFVERHRRLRTLDVLAVGVGLAVSVAVDRGEPLVEEAIRTFLYSALDVTGLSESDDVVNRFFDQLQETVKCAKHLSRSQREAELLQFPA